MTPTDETYLSVLKEVMEHGIEKGDRTGTGTISRFGTFARFDLRGNHIPLLTTRKIFHRSFIHETLWFISGSTDIGYLKDNNVSIWDSWVQPGTERYRELSFEECLEKCRALAINLGDSVAEGLTSVDFRDDPLALIETGDWELRFEDDDDVEGGVKAIYVFNEADVIRDIYRSLRTMELKERITTHQVEDGWTEVIFVHTPGDDAFWAMESVVSTSVREVVYSDIGKLQELCNALTGEWIDIEPRVLVGGSIGAGAYGSQWRKWEDTRIVEESDLPKYKDRGYEKVTDFFHPKDGRPRVILHREIDQLQNVIDMLRDNPDSRRILMIAFNPAKVEDCSLPPCHLMAQWWSRELTLEERLEKALEEGLDVPESSYTPEQLHDVLNDNDIPTRGLSCLLYMRSSDYPVGATFNIPQYALLTMMIAHITNMSVEDLVFVGADTHIYDNQLEGVEELLKRDGKDGSPWVSFRRDVSNIDDFTFEDIEIHGYEHDPVIKFPIAV